MSAQALSHCTFRRTRLLYRPTSRMPRTIKIPRSQSIGQPHRDGLQRSAGAATIRGPGTAVKQTEPRDGLNKKFRARIQGKTEVALALLPRLIYAAPAPLGASGIPLSHAL